MSYIGSTPTTQSFIAGTDYFNGTGSQVAFTLSRSVNSVNDIEVIVNNVEQIPSGYSVSGTTLTFSAAPSSGTSNVYVRYLSTTNLSLAIPAGTSAAFNTVTATSLTATTLAATNFSYTGTLTGGTGVVNLGSGQVYKDASGNVGIGTVTPASYGKFAVRGTQTIGTYGNVSGTFSDGATGSIYIQHSSGLVQLGSDTALSFGTGSSATERVRIESGGNINLNSVVYANTTVNAANMFVNSGPVYQIYRSTSSAKYKTNVETIDDSYSAALLQCRPVWFRSLCSGDNKEHGYWGFIAEEVAAIDPRLVFWTTTETVKNENGEPTTVSLETPIVEGVQYDRFVPHLLNLIKKQNETLTALTARITALESK